MIKANARAAISDNNTRSLNLVDTESLACAQKFASTVKGVTEITKKKKFDQGKRQISARVNTQQLYLRDIALKEWQQDTNPGHSEMVTTAQLIDFYFPSQAVQTEQMDYPQLFPDSFCPTVSLENQCLLLG